jgi:hypothetical protein
VLALLAGQTARVQRADSDRPVHGLRPSADLFVTLCPSICRAMRRNTRLPFPSDLKGCATFRLLFARQRHAKQ